MVATACAQGWLIEEIGAAPVAAPAPAPVATTPDLAAYRQLAQNYSLASGMAYRYGAASTVNNSDLPTQYQPSDKHFNNRGNPEWDY